MQLFATYMMDFIEYQMLHTRKPIRTGITQCPALVIELKFYKEPRYSSIRRLWKVPDPLTCYGSLTTLAFYITLGNWKLSHLFYMLWLNVSCYNYYVRLLMFVPDLPVSIQVLYGIHSYTFICTPHHFDYRSSCHRT